MTDKERDQFLKQVDDLQQQCSWEEARAWKAEARAVRAERKRLRLVRWLLAMRRKHR